MVSERFAKRGRRHEQEQHKGYAEGLYPCGVPLLGFERRGPGDGAAIRSAERVRTEGGGCADEHAAADPASLSGDPREGKEVDIPHRRFAMAMNSERKKTLQPRVQIATRASGIYPLCEPDDGCFHAAQAYPVTFEVNGRQYLEVPRAWRWQCPR